VAAAASLQELAGPRVFLGLGAGGTETGAVAGADRRRPGSEIRAVAALTRSVAAGAPLDPGTGLRLGPPLADLPVLVAGRGDGVLRAAGAAGDAALLWAVPEGDLDRSAGVVATAARGRDRPPTLVWAPLVDHDRTGAARRSIAYSVLNSSPALHARWGLDADALARVRAAAVAGGVEAASALLPADLADEFVLDPDDTDRATGLAARIGAGGLAVRATSPAAVADALGWAHHVRASVLSGPRAT
jgi:hypothetical protein